MLKALVVFLSLLAASSVAANDQSDISTASEHGLRFMAGMNFSAASSYLFETKTEYVTAVRAHRYLYIYVGNTGQGYHAEAGELFAIHSPKSLGRPVSGFDASGNFSVWYRSSLSTADRTFSSSQTPEEVEKQTAHNRKIESAFSERVRSQLTFVSGL